MNDNKPNKTKAGRWLKDNPEIAALVEALQGEILWRAGSFWFHPGELQLTYQRAGDVTLDEAGQIALSTKLLKDIVKAREQPAWGTPRERAQRMLVAVERELIPNYAPRMFCHYRHESMDDATISRFGDSTCWLALVGEEQIRVEAPTWPEILVALRDAIDARWPEPSRG